MTQAQIGFGVALKRGQGDGPPETFTTIPELLTITGPGIKIDAKDATNHGSAQFFKEKIYGLIDAGQVVAEFNWVPGNPQQAGLLADALGRDVRNFQFLLPAAIGLKWSFAALYTGFDPGQPLDDKCTCKVTLDITGPTTLA